MTVELKTDYPTNSTRYLLPTIMLRGFRGHRRELTIAVWTVKLVIAWGEKP